MYYNNPDNIFQAPFFKELLGIHERHNLNITLYVFEKTEDFDISLIPEKYYPEFRKNSDWLFWGYHGIKTGFHIKKQEDFVRSFKKVSAILSKATGNSCSPILRLHYWEANQDQIMFLKKQGVKVLLTCDRKGVSSYNLTYNQLQQLEQEHRLVVEEIEYIKTDIRVDNIKNNLDVKELIHELTDDNKVIFLHEPYLISKKTVIDNLLQLIDVDFSV